LSSSYKGGYLRFIYQYLVKLPIRNIDFSKHAEKKLHDQMVNLVNQILNLNKKLNNAKLPQEKNLLQRQIETTDKQIDQLVYELYDLTDEEIKIVELET
jgi:methionyl-tRNA synthetase